MLEFENFHAHVYFDSESKNTALALREKIAKAFPELTLGRVWESCVGPHPCPSYQIAFGQSSFQSLISFLMQERASLDIFIHADTGADIVDHTQYVLWLGKSYALNLEKLK
ncbi:DOPA 4,5-dioxygenase family protein [Piscirickettsia litoralis]|uniref:4,5-dioxygenase n=1 Tax=Piscirickettsia litoralis TaxID=1891921 RepID=A0ABX3A4V0_9GAMM|nr:DOPA 4,5-dioxygenase family protein [Piscirickettsia litoralis]ODN43267.1 hypothetical protein BGC07_10490 [Piscirickettsia litoralis]